MEQELLLLHAPRFIWLFGAKLENIVMVDSKGVISTRRTDLNSRKNHLQLHVPVIRLKKQLLVPMFPWSFGEVVLLRTWFAVWRLIHSYCLR